MTKLSRRDFLLASTFLTALGVSETEVAAATTTATSTSTDFEYDVGCYGGFGYDGATDDSNDETGTEITMAGGETQGMGAEVSTHVIRGAADPTFEMFDVSERGSPNPHAKFSVEWAVSDADANLDTVWVIYRDSAGSTLKTTAESVGGSMANGSDEFRVKFGGGGTYEIEGVVEDTAGSKSTVTETIQVR